MLNHGDTRRFQLSSDMAPLLHAMMPSSQAGTSPFLPAASGCKVSWELCLLVCVYLPAKLPDQTCNDKDNMVEKTQIYIYILYIYTI